MKAQHYSVSYVNMDGQDRQVTFINKNSADEFAGSLRTLRSLKKLSNIKIKRIEKAA